MLVVKRQRWRCDCVAVVEEQVFTDRGWHQGGEESPPGNRGGSGCVAMTRAAARVAATVSTSCAGAKVGRRNLRETEEAAAAWQRRGCARAAVEGQRQLASVERRGGTEVADDSGRKGSNHVDILGRLLR
ncbi:hypothetical protein GW17_00021477 [Ensete ventricosum]|nr:hypothetical protein GW17_00021477 [Ensete ventricosum]